MRCDHFRTVAVDPDAPPAERRALETHLEGCADCRQAAALQDAIGSLPRSVEPSRDLWPGIADRLAEHPRTSVGGVDRPDAGLRRRPMSVVWRLAAALALMVLGGVLLWLFQSVAPDVLAPGRVAERVPATSGMDNVLASTADPDTALEDAWSEYQRAVQTLQTAIEGRRQALSPAARALVADDLAVIHAAIQELHQALEEHRGDRQLESLLLARYRQELDLLARLEGEET